MNHRLAVVLALAAASCARDLAVPEPPSTTAFLTGRVVAAVPGTATSAPVAQARVALLNTNISGVTDERGIFTLGPVPDGTYRVFFSDQAASASRQRILTGVRVRVAATNSVGDVSLQENALLTGRALIQGRTSGNVGITVFSPGTDYVTTAADNGGWLLANLPEGSIRATAWRPGFTPATTTDIALQGGVVTSAVDLILEPEAMSAPPGTISGSVVVVGREAQSGVTVKAVATQSREVRASVTTDAEGRYVLPNLASDLYFVTFELEGYPSARVPNLAVAGGVQLELEPVALAVMGDGNLGDDPPIGGPSGPRYGLDGGVLTPDGGGPTDGGAIGAECADDAQCASGRLCIDNRCVGCSVNVQCRPGYSCLAGDCVRDCTSNAECPGGLACIGGACVHCITSADCKDPAQVCVSRNQAPNVCAHCQGRDECPVGKACLPSGCGDCAGDGDCGAGAICEQGVCTAGDCHSNADCPASEACVGRACGACTVDGQCRLGQLCVSGACVTGNCRSVTDCQAGQVCLGNQCGACSNDGDCGTGQLCLPGSMGLRCLPGTCRADGDCTGASAGLLCVNNQCLPCGSANPCPSGNICNAQGRCVVGDCFTNLDCTGTKAGWACLSGNCTPCMASAECAASGYVCEAGLCKVGNCVTAADCPLPGQLCLNNACQGCGGSNVCPGGQVCDSDSLCHPGNCVIAADCPAGQVCTNRFCAACTADTQCGPGKLCLSGSCVTGNCHTDFDCGGGTQLCNPVTHTCGPCSPTGQLNSVSCGGGRLCDAAGFCRVGSCLTNGNCGAGQVCVGFSCTSCTADSQCNGGQLCVNNACVTGNCHGTGADPNADCDATNGVCVNHVCVGNCRTNADCAATGLCNPTTHLCTACTGVGQCGSGRVCAPGAGGNTCISGQCSSLENTCGAGEACIGNACVQLGPNPSQPDAGTYVEAGLIQGAGRSPLVVSGRDTLYFSAHEPQPAAGNYTVALEPDLSLRWRVRDSTGTASKNSFGGAGIVLPAPGYPNGELFLVNDGSGNGIAHRSDDGSTAWTITPQGSVYAAGLVEGVPHVAWVTFNSNVVNWQRTDGSGRRSATLAQCGAAQVLGLAWGTKAIYVQCAEALMLVDPVTAALKSVPHGGSFTNQLSNGPTSGVIALWRPPDHYVARGVDSGTVTSDVLVYTGRGGGLVWLLAVRVPDDWVTNPSSTSTWTMWSNTTTNYNVAPLAIDATGAIHLTSQNTLYKVNLFTGQVISQALHGGVGDWWNLGVSGQLVAVTGTSTIALSGFTFADGQASPPAPVWSLPSTPGNWLPLTPTFQKNASASGNLLVFQTNALGQQVLRALAPAPSAPPFALDAPAWSMAGDSASHNAAPAYECTSDAQCAANQTCMLGRCAGTCRAPSQCPAGQGCWLGSCQACTAASQCRGGEVCWVGTCMPCTSNCCSTSADCTDGYCQVGQCRGLPASGGTGSFSHASLVTRPQAWGSNLTVAPDGTMYVGDTTSGNLPFWKVVTPAGVLASTTPSIGTALVNARPMLMVASNGTAPTLWTPVGPTLHSAPASSSVSAWTQATYPSLLRFFRVGQTVSNAQGTGPRPALIAIALQTVSSNVIMAVDAAAASAGGTNPGVLWTAPLGSTCLPTSVSEHDPLAIGSDGTAYVLCPDGSVQAWAPDGDPTSGPPPSRLGLLKWRSAPPPGWPSGTQGKLAIGKAATGDVLYLPRSFNQVGLAVLDAATATNGTVPLTVGVDASGGILTDAQGRAVVTGTVTGSVSVVAPTGVVLATQTGKWLPNRELQVLTADGQLVFVDTTTGRVTAVLVDSPPLLLELFSVTGAGNLAVDSNSGVVVLSTAQLGGGLLAFDHAAVSGTTHNFSGLPFAGTAGPAPNAWSATYGDLQRRNSLKTQ